MSLSEYKRKRNFSRTPEPRSGDSEPNRNPIFVIQEHHASRLHYDFRLEADGVLKSWAVPKRPTLEPSGKRLAVHVEDHPLEYAEFSGTIPEGQYGAGEVKIWDRGTYDNLMAEKPNPRTVTESIEDGHVEVELHGRKLKGRFAIVRMDGESRKNNWLLIKMKSGARTQKTRPRAKKRATEVSPTGATRHALRSPSGAGSKEKSSRIIKFTHLDKVMFPQVGITKREVLDYYRRIAHYLLPYLCDRPATLERFPDGLGGSTRFWQKDLPDYYPSWIPRAEIPSRTGEMVHYPLVNDEETLLYLVNQGTITFHPWLSRVSNLDRPDYVIFDLDPGAAPFKDVVTVAKSVHSILDRHGFKSFVKTSGKSGLHILSPWEQEGVYDEARAWAIKIAELVVADLPEIATVERSKVKRKAKVYVDVMQNVRGHHVVPPYVVRAVPNATVSTPLGWKELTSKLDPGSFTLKTIFRRLSKLSADPFGELATICGS